MKLVKKFLIYSLIFAMLFGLCACQKQEEQNPKPVPANEASQNEEENTSPEDEANTIDEMIEELRKNSGKDIKAYLILGIDRSGEASKVDSLSGGGQSDGIYVVAMDNDNKTYKILQLNRDTYTDVVVPDIFGNVMTTEKERLGLAYGYGAGMEDSCINAERSISLFLHGLKFDGYLALYYDSIAPVVDMLGGVDITIEDDMTAIDERFVKGEDLHLDGQSAYKFCRARVGVGDETNSSRMRRQRSFLNSFLKTLRASIKEKSGIVNDMYNVSSPYMVSNLSQGELCNIALKAMNYKDLGIVTPSGKEIWVTGSDGVNFCRFTVDDENLQNLLKSMFTP